MSSHKRHLAAHQHMLPSELLVAPCTPRYHRHWWQRLAVRLGLLAPLPPITLQDWFNLLQSHVDEHTAIPREGDSD